MAKKSKFFLLAVGILVAVFALVYAGVNLTSNFGKSKAEVTAADAGKRLNKLYSDLSVRTEAPVKGQIDLNPADVAESLPDISKFPIAVDNTTDNFVEIFSSTEKSGTGVDGWLTETATAFNKAN